MAEEIIWQTKMEEALHTRQGSKAGLSCWIFSIPVE